MSDPARYTDGSTDQASRSLDVIADALVPIEHAEKYLTGARVVEMLRRAEVIEVDGPGMAAHQLEAVLDVDEDEAAAVCRLLVGEGYAAEYQTPGGTPYWRYRDPGE